MGIPFTVHIGFLLTITMGILFTIVLGIQFTISKRLKKRLIKHEDELLTFLDHPEIEPTNNRAERALRNSVIMRKITFGNRSTTGIRNHQVIMSILQTASLHHIEPLPIFLSLAVNKEDSLMAFQEEFSSPVNREPKRIRAP